MTGAKNVAVLRYRKELFVVFTTVLYYVFKVFKGLEKNYYSKAGVEPYNIVGATLLFSAMTVLFLLSKAEVYQRGKTPSEGHIYMCPPPVHR